MLFNSYYLFCNLENLEVAELLIDNGGIVYQPPKRPKEPDKENTTEEA